MAYLRAPGTVGSGLVLPYHSSMNESSIIDLRVDVALDDWTPAVATLVGRRQSTSDIWRLQVVAGFLRLKHNNAALSNFEQSQSSVAAGITDGVRYQVRALLNAPAQTCDFYKRDSALGLALSSDTSWTAVGTQRSTTNTTIGNSPAGLDGFLVGGWGATMQLDNAAGDFYGVFYKKGGSTTVVSLDFTDPTTWVYS